MVMPMITVNSHRKIRVNERAHPQERDSGSDFGILCLADLFEFRCRKSGSCAFRLILRRRPSRIAGKPDGRR